MQYKYIAFELAVWLGGAGVSCWYCLVAGVALPPDWTSISMQSWMLDGKFRLCYRSCIRWLIFAFGSLDTLLGSSRTWGVALLDSGEFFPGTGSFPQRSFL